MSSMIPLCAMLGICFAKGLCSAYRDVFRNALGAIFVCSIIWLKLSLYGMSFIDKLCCVNKWLKFKYLHAEVPSGTENSFCRDY